jgi:hypothetical protein
MSIEKSFEGVMGFWKNNQDLITQISETGKDAGDTIKNLAAELEQNRQDAATLVGGLKKGSFQVTKDADIKKQQQNLLEQIQEQQDKLAEFEDAPELTTGILLRMANLYVQLADTFDDTISNFVPFADDEIDQINGLLQQAAVDAAHRQSWADVLTAAVKLGEMALQIAVKVAA